MAITARDSVLTVVPMFHANAWGMPLIAPAVGAKLVLAGRHTDGASLTALINGEGVTVGVGIATVWLGLVEHIDAIGGEVPSLERIIVGGAPLPPALMERIEQRLGVQIQTSWGMTELSPSGTVASREGPLHAAHLSGRPAVGVDLLLTDASGTPLPKQRGIEGHLRVRGASVLERYFGEQQAATDADGWLPTGDLARIDAEGNLIITGRAKDLIKSGGEWISSVDLENALMAHPAIAEAAVIAIPDPKWSERPLACIVWKHGAALAAADVADVLGQHLLGHGFAKWQLPDRYEVIDGVPRTSTGKFWKLKLRERFPR
jgi:fatty-acyl-CoA synthase